jgi:hypothetical protein
VVTVSVVALCGTNVVHLVDGAALGAALDRAVARHGQPSNDVRVGRAAGATNVLLVTERANNDGLLHGACSEHKKSMSWREDGGVMFEVVYYAPVLLASRGFMSKTSMPCIFPRISRRSRPVAWSISVGTVPGWAPVGIRSCSSTISNFAQREQRQSIGSGMQRWELGRHTLEGLDFVGVLAGLRVAVLVDWWFNG